MTDHRAPDLLGTAQIKAVDVETVFHVDVVTRRDLAGVVGELTADRANEPSERLDDEEFLTACEVALRVVSPELLRRLVSFRIGTWGNGALLLRGLPVDDPLPPTPINGRYDGPWGRLAASTLTQLMVMSVLGDVISYRDEKTGRIVQDICPVPGAETRQENTGSHLLELHTEDGFHPHKPDFIGLACLRADRDHSARTVISGVRDVLPHLAPQHAGILREPLFEIRLASSFATDGQMPDSYSPPLPVLSGSLTDPDLCVDFHAMRGLNAAADAALEALREQIVHALVGVVLEPGDLLVINNRKAVHGRTGFSPSYDGTDRWLRRCFVVADLHAARPDLEPGSRVHQPLIRA